MLSSAKLIINIYFYLFLNINFKYFLIIDYLFKQNSA
jgi:hypothetical protein